MPTSILTDLAIRLRANTAELKKNLDRGKKQISDFKKSTRKGTQEIKKGFRDMGNGARQSLGMMSGQFGIMGQVLQRAIGGVQGLSKGMKGLKGVLLSTGIGAIFVAIGTAVAGLMSYFKGTVEGARKFAAITGAVKGVLTALKEILIKVGKFLVKMWEDPKQGVRDLWEAIKRNLVNRFEGVIDFFKSGWSAIANGAKGVAVSVSAIFNKERKEEARQYFEQMAKDMVEVGKASAQIATGLDVEKTFQKAREEAENIKKTSKEAAAIEQRKHDLYVKETALMREEAGLVEEIARLTDISSDKELDHLESLKGTNDAIEVTHDLYAKRVALADEAVKIKEAEMALGSNSKEDERELVELQNERNRLLKEEYDKVRELKNRREEINARIVAEEVKAEREKQAEVDRINREAEQKEKARLASVEQYRVQVLGQTLEGQLQLLDEEYDARLIADNEYASERSRIMEEIAKRDQELAQETADKERELYEEKLSRALAYADQIGQMIDIIGTMWSTQMNKELEQVGDNEDKKEEIERKYAKKQKKLAISKAIIGSAMAVINAMQTIPFIPAGVIAAGMATAAGIAQVANIKSTPLAKGGIAYNPVNALVGEYPGASRNPEVIAPLDKLGGILQRVVGGSGGMSGTVVFEIHHNVLRGILEKSNRLQTAF